MIVECRPGIRQALSIAQNSAGIGWVFDGSIEAETARVTDPIALHSDKVNRGNPRLPALRTPNSGCCARVRKQRHPVNQKDWVTADSEIAPIFQDWDDVSNEFYGKILAVCLFHEDFFITIQTSRPVPVGPTETEWEIRLFRLQELIKRLLEKRAAVAPVIIKTETRDTAATCQ